MTGPAGTVIFCDTAGFHRGGFARTKPRILIDLDLPPPGPARASAGSRSTSQDEQETLSPQVRAALALGARRAARRRPRQRRRADSVRPARAERASSGQRSTRCGRTAIAVFDSASLFGEELLARRGRRRRAVHPGDGRRRRRRRRVEQPADKDELIIRRLARGPGVRVDGKKPEKPRFLDPRAVAADRRLAARLVDIVEQLPRAADPAVRGRTSGSRVPYPHVASGSRRSAGIATRRTMHVVKMLRLLHRGRRGAGPVRVRPQRVGRRQLRRPVAVGATGTGTSTSDGARGGGRARADRVSMTGRPAP